MAQYVNETTILHNGKYIPVDGGNRDYRELIASGITIDPLPTVDPLVAERAAMACTPAQMRLTLLGLNLLTTVQTIADSDPAASIVWEYATQIIRNSSFIEQLKDNPTQTFTDTEIDNIFRAAMAVNI